MVRLRNRFIGSLARRQATPGNPCRQSSRGRGIGVFGTPRWTLSAIHCLFCLVLLVPHSQAQYFPGMRGTSAPEYAAKVVLSTGRVFVAKAGEHLTLMPGDEVQPGLEVMTGPDGYALFQLSDGSSFEVYPNSRVLFRSNWGNWNDIFDVWVGRMKIHIEKIMGKPNPHRIHTPTAVISVRGTVFFVEVEEDSEATLVAVEEGEVLVEHRLLPTGRQQPLRAGEQLRIDRDEPIARARIARDGVLRATIRALSDVLYAVAVQNQRRGASGTPVPGSGGGGRPLPGDEGPSAPPSPPTGGSAPTTTAPPPPPPPPPGA